MPPISPTAVSEVRAATATTNGCVKAAKTSVAVIRQREVLETNGKPDVKAQRHPSNVTASTVYLASEQEPLQTVTFNFVQIREVIGCICETAENLKQVAVGQHETSCEVVSIMDTGSEAAILRKVRALTIGVGP